MSYRLIVMRGKDGFTNMSVDEAILEAVSRQLVPETIRFFDFTPVAITIGRLQYIDEIAMKECKKKGIDVVRRLTGGRAVVHSGDFTFSFIVKRENPIFGGSLYNVYRAVSLPFLRSLHALNIPAEWVKVQRKEQTGKISRRNPLCFSSVSRYELKVRDEKVLGVSQYRTRNTVLIQGTLMLQKSDFCESVLFNSPISSAAGIGDRGNYGISFELFGSKLKQILADTYDIDIMDAVLTKEEQNRARIRRKKYVSCKWNNFRELPE
ncbi:MAG: lipoate--protein ligase family protein [Candidatus Cloacimonadota bacterium]|nr:MAG: lipoate--protein ligase family protein [Candidatus Cloacimonadota bacterium]